MGVGVVGEPMKYLVVYFLMLSREYGHGFQGPFCKVIVLGAVASAPVST